MRQVGGGSVAFERASGWSESTRRSDTVSANRVSFVNGLAISAVGERAAGLGPRVYSRHVTICVRSHISVRTLSFKSSTILLIGGMRLALV